MDRAGDNREVQRYSNYDRLAWFYNKYWGALYKNRAISVLESILFPLLPAAARILDLCCGTGHMSRALVDRGYEVTGVDGSEEMLRYARDNVPSARFILSDARTFSLPSTFDASISTFDSLNHILRKEELTTAFRNVHGALVERGLFVFDLNMEEAYLTMWDSSSAIVERNNVCIVKGSYDRKERIGRTDVVMFRLQAGAWRRSDVTLFQRCYAPHEIRSALEQAGFTEIRSYDARGDLGMRGEIGIGRVFYLVSK